MIDFNPYDKGFAEDPYPIYKALRDEAPVYHCEPLNFWALSRYDDVLEAHRDFATFSSAGGVTIEGMDSFAPLLIVKDPPEHRWHKALITKVFTPQRMGALEPFIRALVVRLLDEAAQKDEFDFVQEFALQVPLQVISELIGIPPELRQEIHELTNKLLDRENGGGLEGAFAAQAKTLEIYMELVRDRRANPREDPITYLINAEVQDDDGAVRRLTDEEMAWRFGELAAAGHETVAKTIPNGAMAFQRFPSERQKLVDHPELLQGAVDEILRFAVAIAGAHHHAGRHPARQDHPGRDQDHAAHRGGDAGRTQVREPGPVRHQPRRAAGRRVLRLRHPPLPRHPPGPAGTAHGVRRAVPALPELRGRRGARHPLGALERARREHLAGAARRGEAIGRRAVRATTLSLVPPLTCIVITIQMLANAPARPPRRQAGRGRSHAADGITAAR